MKKMMSFLFLLAAGVLVGYLGARLVMGDRPAAAPALLPEGYSFYLILLLPLLYFLVVGIHELGHVAAGRWQDFSFYGLTIGPFSWRPDQDGRIQFKWNTSLNLAGGIAWVKRMGHSSKNYFPERGQLTFSDFVR